MHRRKRLKRCVQLIFCPIKTKGLQNVSCFQRKKKETVVWDHATYKQAVRKAMFARFKELD